jgi:ParB family transcriptional regulator, chromosome partitioning protein
MTSATQMIPLNKLVLWNGNVRKTQGADTALAELAASISSHGLINPLTVRPAKKGKYEVGAGGRRLAALQLLRHDGKITDDYPVRCELRGKDDPFLEISLAENTIRENMHPADEFEAFRALSNAGIPNEDIAARFGVTDTVVKKRLKLANVSPVILQGYRDGETDLETVMAFAVTDDHAAQEKVWESLYGDDRKDCAYHVRQCLTNETITASDRRVKFMTLKAYENAGGITQRDLFSDDDSGIFIVNVELLDSLVSAKLGRAAAKVRKEGWKWVEIRHSHDYAEWSSCERRHQEYAPLPAKQQARLEALEQEFDELDTQWQQTDDDAECPERLHELQEQIDAINQGRKRVWTADTLAIGGAVVSIGYNGQTAIERGYVRRADLPKKTAAGTDGDESAEASETETGFTLPASLVETLTAERSAAMAASLKDAPKVALATVVHVLALQMLYNGNSRDACLQLMVGKSTHSQVKESFSVEMMRAAADAWGERIPGQPEDLYAWCLAQSTDMLLELLAFCAARSIDAVQSKGHRPGDDRFSHAGQLATALRLDMAAWFQPTAGNYFGKISKASILTALREAGRAIAPAWEKAKKSDLASIAEREIAATGWLPEPLRSPVTGETPADTA